MAEKTKEKITTEQTTKDKTTGKKKYRVVYDREGCIGAAACVAEMPSRWEMVDDGKADLIGSKKKSENEFILEIGEEELKEMKAAAESCPVDIIKIFDLETGEEVK